MYDKGQGVPQNYIKAYAWFNIAAAQGDENARENRDRVSDLMTPQQIGKAQELSARLYEK